VDETLDVVFVTDAGLISSCQRSGYRGLKIYVRQVSMAAGVVPQSS
jgi:hypothetical protein